ncbi:MFS transporter [Nocardia sp. CA-129566]|uniref:MFS transporter n=1 Tax=Nocardia sp. CA-129566 TaxID=3239976 RepID=UPI003D962621
MATTEFSRHTHVPQSGSFGRDRITQWHPDDGRFWERTGRAVARRNLVCSIAIDHLGFCTWLLWSVTVWDLRSNGMVLSVGQTLWLTTIPNLVGAALRIPYTFAPARYGGRNWSVISAALLLVPWALFMYAASHPGLPYWALLPIAATAGVGGGIFASSMSNITHFYPADKQGLPLGLNAAGGNLGASVTQLTIPPLVLTVGLVNLGLVWMPLIIIAAVCAYVFMDNLASATSAYSLAELKRIGRERHTLIMSILYVGTFGSFIGYSFSFGVLTRIEFPDIRIAQFIWIGALVGAAARPLGGWLADRFGGARVTMIDFVLLAVGIVAVAVASRAQSWPWYLCAFLFVFAATGIGNGSTYKMIPAIFRARVQETGRPASMTARRNAAAAIGIVSAAGAVGGALIQQVFRVSLDASGSILPALAALAIFYLLCMALTWAYYLRKDRTGHNGVSLAEVGV